MLWNYDRKVVAVLALFILGSTGELTSWSSWQTTAAALFLIVSPVGAGSDLGLCLPNVLKSSNGPQSGSGVTVGNPRAMIMIGPTLATNLLSTSLIGLQVWWVVHFSTNSIAFFPQRESTGVNDACWLATSAEIAPLSRLKRSLRCWSNQALHIAAFGYAAAHLSPRFFRFLSVWTQILYLISTYRVLPDPWFAVINASLLYISVRTPIAPLKFHVFPDPLLLRSGPLPDGHHHLCRFTKIPNVHDN